MVDGDFVKMLSASVPFRRRPNCHYHPYHGYHAGQIEGAYSFLPLPVFYSTPTTFTKK